MDIVEWCNNNEGFAMIILSILTLIISIIAIIVSVKTAKLPFNKKININVVFDEKDNMYQCRIYVMNTGNKLIGIFGIWLENHNTFLCHIDEIKYIEPSKVVEYVCVFPQNKIDEQYDKIQFKILDTEQEEHIFEEYFAMG